MANPISPGPIRGLQIMLRALCEHGEGPLPDGVYDTATAAAVAAFQTKNGLPATGQADQETFYAIAAAFSQKQEGRRNAFPCRTEVLPGQTHVRVFLCQAMLCAIRRVCSELPGCGVTGTLDPATEKALREMQRCFGLPVTGVLCPRSWHRLMALTRALCDRNQGRMWG